MSYTEKVMKYFGYTKKELVNGPWWLCGRCRLVRPDTYDQGCDRCASDNLVEIDCPENVDEALEIWAAVKNETEKDCQ